MENPRHHHHDDNRRRDSDDHDHRAHHDDNSRRALILRRGERPLTRGRLRQGTDGYGANGRAHPR